MAHEIRDYTAHGASARATVFAALALAAVLVPAWPDLSVRAQAPPPVTAAELSALSFRNIGPANMSGRFVDMDVVESDPYTMYVASATGGIFKTTDNGITWTPVFEREAVHSIGDIAIFQPEPEHHLGWHGRARQPAELVVGRRRLQVDRRRTHVDERRPSRLAPHRPNRDAPDEPGHRVRRGDGAPLGRERRTRAVPDRRRRPHVDRRSAGRRGHRRRRRRDGPVRPERDVRGRLPAPAHGLRLPRRRSRQRPLQVGRWRLDLAAALGRRACRPASTAASASRSTGRTRASST